MDIEHEFRSTASIPYYHHFYHHIGIFFPHYDYIIFDCPPNLYKGCSSAIFSSDELYVPCNPDRMSYAGLAYLAEKLAAMRQQMTVSSPLVPARKFPRLSGIIMNDGNPKASYRDIYAEFDTKVYQIKHTMPEIVTADFGIMSPMVRSWPCSPPPNCRRH